jgi:hypothetical protein
MKIVSAQMLLNPLAAGEATFLAQWLVSYEVLPSLLNVYILVDPSKGKGARSDRTAVAVIGIDRGGSKYLLDGVCHRMKISERWAFIKAMKRKWEGHPGVQLVRIGYEQYGMLDEISVMKEMMQAENNHFDIVELKTPETGGHSKRDRIDRLEPDIRNGRFLLPCVIHHRELGGLRHWSVWTEERAKRAEAQGKKPDYNVGQLIYREVQGDGFTARQIEIARGGMKYRIVTALRRRDENSDIYDVTRIFIEELIRHPFAAHDDLIDAASRIYDINPHPPQPERWQSTDSLEMEMEEMDELASE